jgi:cell division protein FtsL
MTRLNILLLLVLLVSAVYLVQTSYQSRQLFVALEHERNVAHQLEVEAESLMVERRAQATSLRVERVAREQLQMRVATPAVTQYVADPLVASAPAVASVGGTP